MNDDVTLSIRQIDGAWRLMCAGAPDPVVKASEGIQYIFSGLPVGFFNLALLTGSGLSAETLSARGREACAWAAAQPVPWMLVVTHERLEPGVDAAATLDACGLTAVMPMTGMMAQAAGAAATVPGLQLTVPQDDSGCAAIVDVNALAYGMDLEASKAAIGSRTFWKDHFPALLACEREAYQQRRGPMVDGHRCRPRRHRAGPAAPRVRRRDDAAGVGECGQGPWGNTDRAPCDRGGPAGLRAHGVCDDLDAHAHDGEAVPRRTLRGST
jgi:hypothetical protein